MAEKLVNYYLNRQSETNLSHLQGTENPESRILLNFFEVLDKCKNISQAYGHEAQSRMVQEEAAELIQAVNKYWRKLHTKDDDKASDNVVEECADVLIMIIQELMFQNTDPEMFIELIHSKLDRQLKRLEAGK